MANAKQDEKKAEEKAAEVAEKGRWLADEEDDNALYVSETAYVGTEPERMNYAYEEQKPIEAEPDEDDARQVREKEIFDRLREETEERAGQNMHVTAAGTEREGVLHPSERQPALDMGEGRLGNYAQRTETADDAEKKQDEAVKAQEEDRKRSADAEKKAAEAGSESDAGTAAPASVDGGTTQVPPS